MTSNVSGDINKSDINKGPYWLLGVLVESTVEI